MDQQAVSCPSPRPEVPVSGDVRVLVRTTGVEVWCPYYPAFIERAMVLGGAFANGRWHFGAGRVEQVRDACVRSFGTTGDDEPDLCIVRVHLGAVQDRGSVFLLGRELARRAGHKHHVQLGAGVTLVEGGFYRTGGGLGRPRLAPFANTILEVRDVPLVLAVEAERVLPDVVAVVEVTRSTVRHDAE